MGTRPAVQTVYRVRQCIGNCIICEVYHAEPLSLVGHDSTGSGVSSVFLLSSIFDQVDRLDDASRLVAPRLDRPA